MSVLTALNPDIPQDTYQQAAEDIAAFETSLAEVCVCVVCVTVCVWDGSW